METKLNKTIKSLFILATFFILTTNCKNPNILDVVSNSNPISDKEGKYYDTKVIGNQVWMVENYDSKYFQNGDSLKFVKNKNEWIEACNSKIPAYCYYNQSESNNKHYGKLYNVYAIIDNRKLAPEGWDIPNSNDWGVLENFWESFQKQFKKQFGNDLKKVNEYIQDSIYNVQFSGRLNVSRIYKTNPYSFDFEYRDEQSLLWTIDIESQIVYAHATSREAFRGMSYGESYSSKNAYSVRFIKRQQ